MERRECLKSAAMLAPGAAIGLPQISSAAGTSAASAKPSYPYHGRPDDYTEFGVIEPGRVILKDGRAHFEAGPGWGVKINPEWLKAATNQMSERKA